MKCSISPVLKSVSITKGEMSFPNKVMVSRFRSVNLKQSFFSAQEQRGRHTGKKVLMDRNTFAVMQDRE